MKKTLLGVVLSILFVANSAFAITLQQPVEIGAIVYPPANGILIKNAIFNSGNPIGKFQKETMYDRGVAQFGNNNDAIYVHYAPHQHLYFGDKNKNSTLEIESGMYGTTVFQIKNDSDIKLYMLRNNGPMAGTISYILLGRRSDGVFVKYFNMEDINIKYFNLKKNQYGTTLGRHSPWYKNCRCQGDTIIIDYERPHGKSGFVKEGEFRFKWDDKAQWFGVEHVVY